MKPIFVPLIAVCIVTVSSFFVFAHIYALTVSDNTAHHDEFFPNRPFALLQAHASVSIDRTLYPPQNPDPLDLWNSADVIIDGTVVEVEKEVDQGNITAQNYHVKVNEYFKGTPKKISLLFVQNDYAYKFKEGENGLFYLKSDNDGFGYELQPHSVKTSGDCDARSLIEITPVLPNERPPVSSPAMTESYFDPCLADYFSYDPDFFAEIVNGISPLKQKQHAIPDELVRCYEDMVKVTKYDGSPACIKPETKVKLIERGWAKPAGEWTNHTPIETKLGKLGTYELQKGGKIFDIKYHIKGGSDIKEIVWDTDSRAINIILKQYDSGSIEITLPRELIDAKLSEDVDDLFFVLIDGEEVPYTEATNEIARTLTVQFDKNSKVIEIIGTMPL